MGLLEKARKIKDKIKDENGKNRIDLLSSELSEIDTEPKNYNEDSSSRDSSNS